MRRIPRRYYSLVFAFFTALLMSCLMSFVIVVITVGFVPNLAALWLESWATAFPVAFGAALFVVPNVRRIVDRLVEPIVPQG